VGIINILDTQTANMIAAGEVVEKPASAVKEMLENSIDADASHISCEIRGGGNVFIRITDDGKGISGEDLPKAILPHATSKILTADDLDGVLTLGFRGEALAAISSVSRLEILSKTKDSPIGHKLTSDENGVEITEDGSPDGTVITVNDLFYNVPARRKFMRKDTSEASAITSVVAKAALSHPEISFKMVSDGTVKFITPGDGDLYSAIYATLGKEFANSLTAVASVYDGITVGGYISKPGESRGSRSGQYFFVNGRPVQSTQIMAALEQAFKSYMPPKRFPAAVLKIEVPPKSVDVNVHPAKTEIKFADDRKIFNAVYSSVLTALRGESTDISFVAEDSSVKGKITEPSNERSSESVFSIENKIPKKPTPLAYDIYTDRKPQGSYIFLRDPNVPLKESFEERVKKAERNKESDFISRPLTEEIAKRQEEIAKGTKLSCVPNSNVHDSKSDFVSKTNSESTSDLASDENDAKSNFASEDTAELKSSFETVESTSSPAQPTQFTIDNTAVQLEQDVKSQLPAFKVIGEAFGGYIIAETESALLLIDKHAAHERILYEDLASKRTSAQSQLLLSPHVVRPGVEATEILLENSELLLSYGFEIDSFGNDSVAVRAIPATLTGINGLEALLDEFAANLALGDRLSFSKRCDRALYTLACKAAIKLGPPSKNEELEVLVEKLISDKSLQLCPHGRPIVKKIPKREIEKFFDR